MGRQFFRPSLLIALSAAVVVGAVVVVLQGPPAQGLPTPLPVQAGEHEIVWLYPATEAASWERFVAAVRRTAERLQPYRRQARTDDKSAFPQQTTTVPEVSLSWSGPGPRFVFRWYKLTGDGKTRDWIAALLARRPPPLAIIGGSFSDSARELAAYLHRFALELQLPDEDRPLLLLTSATADRVAPYREGEADLIASSEAGVSLTQLYPGRTFRFCFTNKQMALAVSDFIWWRDDLRPTRDPVYMAMWNDDSYSRDLIDGFGGALRQVMARDLTNQWAWATSQALFGVWPPGRGGGIFPVQRLRMDPIYPLSASSCSLDIPPAAYRIDSSVGSFDTPNPYEARVAGEMLDHCLANWQPRPLLIVAGQAEPSRRFLRGLVRGVPSLSKRAEIVVATGDSISFNTVYRDGQVAWNIQDLPFPLVFFCHRNPIDASAGFRAASGQSGPAGADERDSTAQTGTEDVLLFGDIVEALVQTAVPAEGMPCAHAAELAERLAEARREGDRIVHGGAGVPLFDRDGQRRSGTGEHVVCLQPEWNEDFKDRLLPRATIEVWTWRRRDWERGEHGQHWQRRGEPLTVWYNETH
ncbi:MAG: type 1 periplasmic-binding domain-containing protein [Gemmataceae bacterium]